MWQCGLRRASPQQDRLVGLLNTFNAIYVRPRQFSRRGQPGSIYKGSDCLSTRPLFPAR